MKTRAVGLSWLAIATITLLAGALRLTDLQAVRLDPFYDAAVRSMGLSWHNFFFGAYEPSGSVSIDKPPVDLWLQVASVKLLGWSSWSLKLPEALAGTIAVPVLFGAIKRPFGTAAGLVAALTLAVMPIEVITARSDTMDATMMLLLVLALYAFVRSSNTAWLLAGAALLGLAFNVKLLESLVALPGLALLAWLVQNPPWWHRLRRLALTSLVYVAVALCWLGATLLFPAHERPYAIGSTNGSAWNAAFVFNGLDRIGSSAAEVHSPAFAKHVVPPSVTRLLAHTGELPAKWFGWQALVALLLGLLTMVALALRRLSGIQRAAAAGVFLWLLSGLVLFSAMTRLHPRYVEGFTPAVAAMWGIGIGVLLRESHRQLRWSAVPITSALAFPLVASVSAVGANTSDAGAVGAMEPREQRALSAYLLAHQGDARYQLAAGSATSVASLIVQDARPVLMLTSYGGRPLTSVARLRELVARGAVRYALIERRCPAVHSSSSAGCAPAVRWVRAHGKDVSRAAGLHSDGILWRLPVPVA